MAPEKGTGWHRHEAEFHIVLMPKGWARFMYGDEETLVEAGDCVHQRPGIVHYLFDYSPDMEYLEIVGPADFTTVDMPAPARCLIRRPWPAEATRPASEVHVELVDVVGLEPSRRRSTRSSPASP